MTWQELYQQMNDTFTLGELEGLAFDLQIDYEHLAGKEKREKIRSLILYCYRRGQTEALIQVLNANRPQYEQYEWSVPKGKLILNDDSQPPLPWIMKMLIGLSGIGFVAIIIIFAINVFGDLPEPTPISNNTPTATLTSTPTPTPTPIFFSCNLVVGEIILGKKVIPVDEEITASIRVENPDNVPVLFNWSANYGDLDPDLRTTSIQTTYYAPSNPTDDVIFLEVIADQCKTEQRSIPIKIVSSQTKPTESSTPTITPSDTPIFVPTATGTPTNTPTPTEVPSLLIESFENYTESILRESFPLNLNAGNEGMLRLVGAPYVGEGNGLVALAFEYEIKNSETGRNYIGFDRHFPAQDWSGYTSFCVWIMSDETNTNPDIIIQFGETGQEEKYTIPLSQINGDYCVPLAQVSDLNLKNIGYYGIYIEASEILTSTIYIDDIRVK